VRILYLVPFCPFPPTSGATIRMYHLLRHLAARHDVTVLGYGTEGDERRLAGALPAVKAVGFCVRRGSRLTEGSASPTP
jgi:hypothetical protein